MAIINLETPFHSIKGDIEEKGIIYRRKQYKDDNGRVIYEGQQEAYAVRNPRDYRKNPPQGAELSHLTAFGEASKRTRQIIAAARMTDNELYTLPQDQQSQIIADRQLYNDFFRRYKLQLPNTRGTHSDPEAPLDKHTGKPKRFARFDNFLRAMIYRNIVSNA